MKIGQKKYKLHPAQNTFMATKKSIEKIIVER